MRVRNRLTLNMLAVTACSLVWLMLITGAEDGGAPLVRDTAVPERDSSSRSAADNAGSSGELSLFPDANTTAAQTRPDDPKAVLRTGVTVASSPSAINRGAVPSRAMPPGDGSSITGVPPEAIRQRQDRLSFGSDAQAADRPVQAAGRRPLGGSGVTSGPVLEVYATDRSERTPAGAGSAPQLQSPPVQQAPVQQTSAAQSQPAQPRATPPAERTVTDTPVLPAGQPAAKPVVPASGAASKPAVTQPPAAKPQPAAVKPATSLTQSLPPADETPVPASRAAEPPPAASGTSLREHFSAAAADGASDSVQLPAAGAETAAAETTAADSTASIISSELPGALAGEAAAAPPATLGEALRNGGVGQEVPAVPPMRIGILLALMAGLIAFAVWARNNSGRNPFGLLKQKSVNVIETISLAPGRQIVLVELRGSALVLGVTPQSINLLDKVPLELLEENYQPTVQQIIHREGTARSDWAARPKVAAMGGGRPVGPSMAPPLYNSYGPPPQGRMSVAELRRQHAGTNGGGPVRSSGFHSYRGNGNAQPPRLGELRVTERPGASGGYGQGGSAGNGSRPGKSELLDSLREQLRKLEE